MKIKTPPLNVDNTQTKIDGGIDFSFDGNVQSSVNIPMVKLQVQVPQIEVSLDWKRQGLSHWRLSGNVTPKIQGTTVDHLDMSTQIDSSQLLQILMNAVLKGIAEGKLKD